MSKQTEWFVSYHFTAGDKEGFGNAELTQSGKKFSIEAVEKELRNFVAKKAGTETANVAILNFTKHTEPSPSPRRAHRTSE